ncbi:MAG: hypothetical protein E7271_04775 [Lachnospiraceae bacterium]|jgi:hypothetical protein|nr:hypothetical protein [Lachnospiraceae bacterium]
MNNKRINISRKSILYLIALGIGLVLLWCVFYFLTINVIRLNMTEQTKTTSDAIISRIEDEILIIDDTAYSLAHYEGIRNMVQQKNTMDFYNAGADTTEKSRIIIGNQTPIDNAVVFRRDGLYYRLKGKMSNTALDKVYNMIVDGETKTISVSSNGMTYLGSVEPVEDGGENKGYVVLFMERTELEKIFNDYNDMEYVGMILIGKDEILCSNRDISYGELNDIKNESVFYKEKIIGFTGFSLIVYSDKELSQKISRYFVIAIPATIIVFLLIVSVFIRHLNKVILQVRVKDIELENEKTLSLLLKKQINAHFTVNTLNAVRALINKGNKNEAAATCEELSRLLRYANAGEEDISLMEEFYVLEQYAAIMQTRYPDKFTFNADMEDEYEDIMIPRMLLQPIVENAIVHGLSDRTGQIDVFAQIDDDIRIYVKDNGCGLSAGKLNSLKERIEKCDNTQNTGLSHMALINIQKRIRMVCGEGYGIDIISRENEGTTVVISLKNENRNITA